MPALLRVVRIVESITGDGSTWLINPENVGLVAPGVRILFDRVVVLNLQRAILQFRLVNMENNRFKITHTSKNKPRKLARATISTTHLQ